ncbi:hypothetical protein [Microbispora sp. KK1-11]|uniref:hypothetical protein n=1 Tax=Microbispora sp. KK1-11 TaxID=2053005 RepID=UPI00115743D1|nr:hypothetical protein [Microbispora sp. KK1-11]TQS29157.1 hypothetical protein FLW16_12510 [Microbispora sp. KK1-11]
MPEQMTPEERDAFLASMTALECRLVLCALANVAPEAFDAAAAAVQRDRALATNPPKETR